MPFFYMCYYIMNLDCKIFLLSILIIGIFIFFFFMSIDDNTQSIILYSTYILYLLYLIYNALYINVLFSLTFFYFLYVYRKYNNKIIIDHSKNNFLSMYLADQIIISDHLKKEFITLFYYY